MNDTRDEISPHSDNFAGMDLCCFDQSRWCKDFLLWRGSGKPPSSGFLKRRCIGRQDRREADFTSVRPEYCYALDRLVADGCHRSRISHQLGPVGRETPGMVGHRATLVIDENIALWPFRDQIDDGALRATIGQGDFQRLFDMQFATAKICQRAAKPHGLCR